MRDVFLDLFELLAGHAKVLMALAATATAGMAMAPTMGSTIASHSAGMVRGGGDGDGGWGSG